MALTFYIFMLISAVRNIGRGQNENKEYDKYIYKYTLFALSTLSNNYSILHQSGYFSY